MRLIHIKLAGFKSFVDPTHVALPGQLVGVVGPNGCGKSNVIDAVRWVLGESSAKHLRGETMEDVIFNGSGNRKPVNRASVELVFDNSLGRATGPWSQYGEIAIKRVLERESGSSYFINNTPVRRRDVADLFLGTGLGARAYAIIEQGMISRIVEAKPEELRVFLEEAAGVSKYRDRRKETESRIEDTRENLTRVDDIRRELESQISHLDAQAQAAERFRTLEADTRRNQNLLWLVRRQDAAVQRERAKRDLDQLTVDIEQATATLREAESRLEGLRENHFGASDAVHAAQGALYESNAELARAEQELQFLRTSRGRAENRLSELQAQIAEQTGRRSELENVLVDTREALANAVGEAEIRAEALLQAQSTTPEAEQAYRDARAESERSQQALAEARRGLDVASTRRGHAERVLGQLESRRTRLDEERAAIEMPDASGLDLLREEGQALEEEIAALRARQSDIEAALPGLDEACRAGNQAVESMRQKLASMEARRHALAALQQQVGASDQMAAWLGQHGLVERPKLWQRVRVQPGWEDALEAILRERLNAIAVQDPAVLTDWFGASPPGKLAIYRSDSGAVAPAAAAPEGCVPLISRVSSDDPALAAALAEWPDRVYALDLPVDGSNVDRSAENAAAALAIAGHLAAGEMVVTREGHVFTAHSVGFHAADSEIHGLLARKQEIEQLEAELPALQDAFAATRARLVEAEAERHEQRGVIDRLREQLTELGARRHGIALDEVKASQALERARHRQAQIDGELAEIADDHAREAAVLQEALEALAGVQGEIEAREAAVTAAAERYRACDQALSSLREAVLRCEREAQEARFVVRSYENRIQELSNSLAGIAEQLARAQVQQEDAAAEATGYDDTALTDRVAQALEAKTERERRLAGARDALAEAERALRGTEQERQLAEQRVEPMRERIGDLRLKEQEARLAEENFAQQLADAQADEAALLASVDKMPRPGVLQAEINRLNEEVAALGAVNLAALDELKTASERKAFLDAQSADLNEAMATLEDAIRRIDRETRERLQATFDEVNRNLAEMFPTLFGGGEAKLVMTGEEILDSGVQIVARPPGKKNASIHLLSGGEKALTAVSLVFSLFRLNPAPFCLLDEVDAPLDDTNTGRFSALVKKMSDQTQFIFISHNKITMEIADQLIGVTMPELGVSRIVAVDIEEALKMREEAA